MFNKQSFSRCFLINTADRVIRVYNGSEVIACGKDGEPEPVQKLQDLVNKWVFCFILFLFILYLTH